MKKQLQLTMLALLGMAASLLSSCSGDKKDALEVIPSDVDFVVGFNGQKGCDQCDIKWTDTEYTLPQGVVELYKSLGIQNNVTDSALMIAMHKSLDIDHSYLFGYVNGSKTQVFTVVAVKDKDVLSTSLTDQYGKPQDMKGFDIYNAGPANLLVKDGLMWGYVSFTGADADASVEAINAVIEKAGKGDVTTVPAIINQLRADNACNVVLKTDRVVKGISDMMLDANPGVSILLTSIADKVKGSYFVSDCNVDGASALSKSKFVNPDGNIIEIPFGSRIDRAYLKYVPDYYNVSAAVGLGESDIADITKSVGAFSAGGKLPADIDSLLRNVEGTISFSLAFTDSKAPTMEQLTSSSFKFVATLGTKQGKTVETLGLLSNLLAKEGIKSTLADSTLTLTQAGETITMQARNADQLIVLSNSPISADNSNSFAPEASASDAFVSFVMPLAGLTDGRCDYVFDTSLSLADNVFQFGVSLDGCQKGILEGFMEAISAFIQGEEIMMDNEMANDF